MMDCPRCDKKIEAPVNAEIITEEGVEVVALYLTCEHCKCEMYTAVRTTEFEDI